MEKHLAKIGSQGVVRRSGEATPFNAGDALAVTVDVLRLHGVKIPPTLRARLGRSAKSCLSDGFSPEQVVRALVTATRRARVDLVEQLLLEDQLTDAGIFGGTMTPAQIIQLTKEWK